MRSVLIRLLLACLVVCWGQWAWAFEFLSEKCEYTEKELSDPDRVIELRLADKKHCARLMSSQDTYPAVTLPNFPEMRELIHPEKATRELAQKYGRPKGEIFEPTGGAYREYKILGKRPVPPIDGHETLEYTVELLYVLQSWGDIPGVYPDGLVPVCERNTVKLYAVKTDRGWYTVIYPGMGYRHDPTYEATRKRTWGRDTIEKDIARVIAVVSKCKDHLN